MAVTPGIMQENRSGLVPDLEPGKNYADDETVRDRIKREIVPLVASMRSRKRALNEEWKSYYKVWTLTHQDQGYEGRSNIYVPAGKKGIETIVSQLVSGTFTSEDAFGVTAQEPEYEDAAYDVQEALKQRLEKMRVRSYSDRIYRQLAIIGTAPVKMYYDKRVSKATSRQRGQNGLAGLIDFNRDHVRYDAPAFRTLDAGNLYVFPEDVETPEDVEVWAEDLSASIADLRVRADRGTYSKSAVEEAIKTSRNPDLTQNTEDRLEAQMINSPHNIGVQGWEPIDVTEVWLDFDPRAASKMEERAPVPFLITITSSGCVLRAMRNPFWHQRSPYLLGRVGTMTGRFWGTGFVEAIRQIQILLNDQTNQGMDAGTYALNPIFLVDPNAVLGTLKPIEPGVQWLVNDINKSVKTLTPDMGVLNATSMLTTQSMAWINDFIGAPPVLQGGSSPGRAFKTATGVGAAMANARLPLQEIVRSCEEDIWEPMLEMTWWLDQQFASKDFLFRQNKNLRRVPPAMLAGDYAFKWLASSQTDNRGVKGSQILQLIQILSNPTLLQMFQAKGIKVNPKPLVKRLYTEVFGLRDVDDVLVEEALNGGQPVHQPMTPEVQGPPGPPQPGMDQPYNLPEWLAGAEGFQETRENADLLAALEGQNNTPAME